MAFGRSKSYSNQPNAPRERKDNSGVLYESQQKKNQNSPDYWGYLTVEGREFKVSGWIKESPKGEFLSLSVQPKDEARDQGYQRPQQRYDDRPRQDNRPPPETYRDPPRQNYQDRRPINDPARQGMPNYDPNDPGPNGPDDYGDAPF